MLTELEPRQVVRRGERVRRRLSVVMAGLWSSDWSVDGTGDLSLLIVKLIVTTSLRAAFNIITTLLHKLLSKPGKENLR